MRLLATFFLFCICSILCSQNKPPSSDVNNPIGEYDIVPIHTNEGTWMNLDISPDGKTIAFDLLGDIYTMPFNGGKASAIRTGLAWEVQPRWSPDGSKLLFTSDADGGDNIWTMKPDGSDAKAITNETFRLLNNGEWMPDGNYIIARKHFTSTRSLGAGEIWMYHITGGNGIQLTKRKNDQQDVNEPTVSPNGRYIYYSEDVYPGGMFQYNKDPNDQIFVIKRYDRENGETKTIVGGSGGACRPQISNDGRKIAYIRRVRTKTVLFVHDIESGQDFPIYDNLSKDQQEAWTTFGTYPGFDWTPDDSSIYIWSKGKIRTINIASKKSTVIPFEVEVNHKMMKTVEYSNDAFTEKMEIHVLRDVKTSPDGQNIVFNALGRLYQMKLPNGVPKRITNLDCIEAEPSFSPDGKKIVYVTWDDEEYGAIRIIDMHKKTSTKLTKEKGIYRSPSFSPDGKKIVYHKEKGNIHMGYSFNRDAGIYQLDLHNHRSEKLLEHGEFSSYSSDGQKIYFSKGGHLFGSIKKSFESLDLKTKKTNILFDTKYTARFTPSPDNKWIAFTELYKVYITPMPGVGEPFILSSKTKAVPVAKVAKDAGINLHWSSDSKKLHWTLGNKYFSESLTDRFLFLDNAIDSLPPIDSVGLKINLEVPMDKPSGSIAFTNARIITMRDNEVIENGSIVINENKILAIGKSNKVDIPKNAKTYNLNGKTIMPGLIDVHAHLGAFRGGLSPEKHWQYYANLAYGITTTHDPSVNTVITFAQSEMVKSGAMVGPRIFSTGTILYGADGDFKAEINSLNDARSALRRTKAYGAFSVKSYNQPRRIQRQWIIQAARELGLRVVPEGGSFFYHNMGMIADGHSSIEHNIPVVPLYKDVIDFWSATNTSNTPTLIVNYGSINGEYYWYQNTEVWKKKRLLAFTPRPMIDSRSRHRTMIPQEEYDNGHILTSKSCNALQNAGTNINLGSHGQLQGLGAHWELWMFVQGGMSTHQALKSATINGAKYLGMEHQLGSLEVGKLADLIVIDGNPLESIQDTENVIYTMINGRLYDANTMNEMSNTNNTRSSFYWEREGSNQSYPFYIDTHSFMPSQCACRQ